MTRIAVFYAVQILVSAYALRRGGSPERMVAGVLLAAAVLTSAMALLFDQRFVSVELSFFAVDIGLFAVLCVVTVYADRYWPLWLASLQMTAIAVHAARAYDPNIVPYIYAWVNGEIAYPMMLVLLIGTLRHARRERQSGPERGWWRHERRGPLWEPAGHAGT